VAVNASPDSVPLHDGQSSHEATFVTPIEEPLMMMSWGKVVPPPAGACIQPSVPSVELTVEVIVHVPFLRGAVGESWLLQEVRSTVDTASIKIAMVVRIMGPFRRKGDGFVS
jgi:hypothetical protein